MTLRNRVNSKVLKEKMRTSDEPRTTLSFYKYHRIDETGRLRDELFRDWSGLDVLGRIYLATEGINAQLSVPTASFETFRDRIYAIPFLHGIRLNTAVDDNGKSFFKLKILVRSKIVADGITDPDFDVTNSGTHVNADDFNNLADQPDTIIVDMRNHYESEVGHFRDAICPDADTFREELNIVDGLLSGKEDRNVIMYCTGGIRCEKASAWMKHNGFKNVFQLDGGIIEYTRQVKEKGLENKFIGKNFVFDERLGERVSPDVVSNCHQCDKPCDEHTNCRNDGCHLLFIQCEECEQKYDGCCSPECKDIIQLPPEVQKEIRRGVNKGRQVFRKGRASRLQGHHDNPAPQA